MISSAVLKQICHAYDLDYLKFTKTKKKEYPHITFLLGQNKDFVLKKIICRSGVDYDKLFQMLSSCGVVLIPCVSQEYSYYYQDQTGTYLLYPRINNTTVTISTKWWATSFARLHGLDAKKFDFKYTCFDEKNTVEQWLLRSAPYFDKDILSEMRWMLSLASYERESACDLVVSHMDASFYNVLTNNKQLFMIDSENCAISPKEFDIQHLLWNQLLIIDQKDEFSSFFYELLSEYETQAGKIININILKQTFILDFVKSISWLTWITKNNERDDYKRQKKELDSLCEKIRNGFHRTLIEI